jgi:hypothetical protein
MRRRHGHRRPRADGVQVPATSKYAHVNAPPGERVRRMREAAEGDVEGGGGGGVDPFDTLIGDVMLAIERADAWQAELVALCETPDFAVEASATHARARALGLELCDAYDAAWRRHTALRDAVRPESREPVHIVLRTSWIGVARLAWLVRHLEDMLETGAERDAEWPTDLFRRASHFSFVATVTDAHASVAMSDDLIGHYSTQTLMTAASVLSEMFDAYGWTPSGGDYLRALFLRYALILHAPAKYAAYSRGVGPWEVRLAATVAPPASGTAARVTARAELPDPLLAPARVRSAFLDVGERMFFHHLWRDRTLASFWRPSVRASHWLPSLEHHRRRATWRAEVGLPALMRIARSMLGDKILRETVITALQNMYPARVVWPGEREQMLFQYPTEAQGGDPYQVLFRLRNDDYKRMQATLHFDEPLAHVRAVVESESLLARQLLETRDPRHLPSGGELGWLERCVLVARTGPVHERVLLLLFEIVLDLTVRADTRGLHAAVFAESAYTDDRSLAAARARPPPDAAHLARLAAHTQTWPTFVAVWLNYAVAPVGGGPGGLFVTPHLVEALGAWLAYAWAVPSTAAILARTSLKEAPWRDLALPPDLLEDALLVTRR